MVVRIKSTRFDLPGAFKRIIVGNFALDDLKEGPEDEEWFSDEHRVPLKRLLDRYGSNMTHGLDPVQVVKNRLKYGTNTFETSNSMPTYTEGAKVIKSFFFGLNTLIWLCAVLSLSTSAVIGFFYQGHSYGAELLFGTALILVTIISGFSFYYQEFKSARTMKSFNQLITPHFAMVKRDGHFKEVFVDELVVGDIVKLTYGDIIPADIRLIECHEFFVDNSSLTGESDPKRRHSICTDNDPMESKNLVFYSTGAVEGHAKGVVVAVGSNTVMGKMVQLAGSVEAKKAKSPIVSEIENFIKIISIRSLVVGLIFFFIALALQFSWQDCVSFFTEIIVASIPEGLNLTCTMLLVMMAKSMASKHCLVKNLHALETLASCAVLITDKTGTLTQNKMSIAHLWFNDKFAEADTSEFVGGGESSEGDPGADNKSEKKTFNKLDPSFKALARVARLCSRAKFKPMQGDVPIFRRQVNGDASESAILRFMETQFKNVKKYRTKHKILCEIPFNSRTRYQVFVHEIAEKNHISQHFVSIKGAPEEVLKLCDRILINETEFPLTNIWRNQVEQAIQRLGSLGERVIGFGDCMLPQDKYNESFSYISDKPEFLNSGLRFVGLMSMIDPPRAAVPDAIRKCRNAGVRVVMVSGDHPTTAVAIGRVVGIIAEGNETLQELSDRKQLPPDQISPARVNVAVVTGSELKRMDSSQLEAILTSNKELIFARTNPEQKFKIVEAFQKLGHLVALSGDGVNDANSLKKADIGISMGITGTEVTKAISDMVLLDDNFTSVVDGIEEGRRGFENLKKILAYSLADNVAEMWSFMLCIVLKIPLPLGTMAILLTVLGTDLFPSLSLMYETSETDTMRLKPRNPSKDKLITSQLITHTYLQVAVLEAVAGYFSYFATMASFGFMPLTLIGIRNQWENRFITDLQDSWGQEWTFPARKRLETYSQTAFFVAIVIMQVANVIICKTRRQSIFQKKMTNWTMNLSILVALGLTCGIIYIRPFASFFGMTSLKGIHWLLPLPFALFLIVFDELRRLFLRQSHEVCGTYHKMLSF